ncbi:MAG: hypothetical protein Q7P63_02260 [Verrucomicrobiota bacterium JB022]|nr:hypothetical protein [Verrucomicrobiota bacterium JB022]
MPVPPHIVTSVYSLPLAAQAALAERLTSRLQRVAEAVCHHEATCREEQERLAASLAGAQADGMAYWLES